LLCLATAFVAQGQTFTTLVDFDDNNGDGPSGSLVQGLDGNLYGTTADGGGGRGANCYNGTLGCGTVFKITPGGTLTTLYSFCIQTNCPDGAGPSGLVLATDGNFYGMSGGGGANDGCGNLVGCGTVFKITPGGKLTTLYRFCSQTSCPDGYSPFGPLVQGTDGNFYGIAQGGGAHPGGTVFRITPSGTLTTIYNFCAQTNCSDGTGPNSPLVLSTDGDLYGTTAGGGNSEGSGTAFKITTSGTLTTLLLFDLSRHPEAGLVQATDGNFYGTSFEGGGNRGCGDNSGCGSAFKMKPGGALTTLYRFCSQTNCTDGASPQAPLVQGTDGNFYGTTSVGGGNNDEGTVFRIMPSGALTTLHTFVRSPSTDGYYVTSGLVQATDGNFYGSTTFGGTSTNCNGDGCGTLFSLSVGLGPFVRTLPTSGKVGAAVKILGTDLTGATGVSFNGTAATFSVVSSSEIKTTVPTGATTGTVKVTTTGGTLKSNVVFRIP
jgi:uncharacterized repeat protein (TIGR03803 family)